MSYQVSLGQSLKNMMPSEFQDRLGNQKSIFTNDISLILDRGPMIGYFWSHAPAMYQLQFSPYILWLGAHAHNQKKIHKRSTAFERSVK